MGENETNGGGVTGHTEHVWHLPNTTNKMYFLMDRWDEIISQTCSWENMEANIDTALGKSDINKQLKEHQSKTKQIFLKIKNL